MFRKKRYFYVENPCPQPWENMTPNELGAHCKKCERTVVDFSGKSDAEFLALYSNQKGKVCGKFRSDQLDRMVIADRKEVFDLKAVALGMAVIASSGYVLADNSNNSPLLIECVTNSEPLVQIAEDDSLKGSRTLVIWDEMVGEPVIGARIYLYNSTNKLIGRYLSDINGRAKIDHFSDISTVKVRVVGFADKLVEWSDLVFTEGEAKLSIQPEEMELIIIGEVIHTKKARRKIRREQRREKG